MMHHVLIAECYFDTLIIKTLAGFESFGWKQTEDFWHCFGTHLFVQMEKRGDKGITVGFFDKNKNGMGNNEYMKNFSVFKQENGVQWLKHKTLSNQHVFYIEKGAEKWFLEGAESVLIENTSIPKFEDFKRETKKENIDKQTEGFIRKVIQCNPPQIQTLREYIIETFNLNQ